MNYIDVMIARKMQKSAPGKKAAIKTAIKQQEKTSKMKMDIEKQIQERMKQRLTQDLEYQNVLTDQEQKERKLIKLDIEKRMQEKQLEKGSFYAGKTLRSEVISSIEEKMKRLKF